ncbi:annexin A5-like [Lineus longissimus]|uniref:annexin A5-like n=1 Tax=Lineus longissimus TaxID=88925 RepID=UPI00315C8754
MAEYYQGTVLPMKDFDAERASDSLRKSMEGLGTDEKRITRELSQHCNAQRQEIAAEYKTKFGRDLVEDLKSELKGDCEKLCCALMVPSSEYDAVLLHQAIKNLGTDDQRLIDIICTASNDKILKMKEVYRELYGVDLAADIDSDTSGHFQRILLTQLVGNRDDCTQHYHKKSKEDAQKLYDVGEGRFGTEEDVFNHILGSRSYAHLRHIFYYYKKISGDEIETAIEGETSSSLQKALLAIVKIVKDRPAYFAEQIYNSMKGLGTDDDSLISLIVSHSEIDMVQIKKAFLTKYNTFMESMIKDDCSGDYCDLLLAVIGADD